MNKKTKQLRLLQLIEEIDDYAILLLDEHGQIESWNKGAEKIKGYTGEEIVGKNFSVFYTQTDRENKLPEQLLRTAASEKTVYNEAWRVRKDGSAFWGAVTIRALYDDNGQLCGFAKITHDLTDRIVLENRARQHAGELEAKNKEIEQFVYIASHDLQEPLLTVANFIEFLRDEYAQQLDTNALVYLDYMTSATLRMQSLIHSLLDYSRLGIDQEKTTCDSNVIVQAVIADLDTLIRETGTMIRLNKLPVFSCYSVELGQLFQNLISNAIKFRRDGFAPEVNISAVMIESSWMFRIADNGIGIEPQFRDKIFLIFQRLHDRNTFAGNGIGLAHCKKIVELHQGSISVIPNPGGGSIFQFTIPLNPQP